MPFALRCIKREDKNGNGTFVSVVPSMLGHELFKAFFKTQLLLSVKINVRYDACVFRGFSDKKA